MIREEDAVRVVNRTREIVLGDKVRTVRTLLSRLVGLLGTAAIADGEGLWIVPCRGVHTLGCGIRSTWRSSMPGGRDRDPGGASPSRIGASFGVHGGRWSCGREFTSPPALSLATGWSSEGRAGLTPSPAAATLWLSTLLAGVLTRLRRR